MSAAANSGGERAYLDRAEALASAGSAAASEAAITALLDAFPLSILGNVRKGEARARANDRNLAIYFLREAMTLADWRTPTAEEAEALLGARPLLSRLQSQEYEERAQRLATRGHAVDQWSPRLRHALDLAAGRRNFFPQKPTLFDYPGLPLVEYYDPADFAWSAAVEAAAPAIRAELEAVLAAKEADFQAYLKSGPSVPLGDNKALVDSRNWSLFPLCENGWLVPEAIEACPRTWETVLKAPVPRVAGWGPTIVFSMLKAGAHIAPHTGMVNARLICHLPLIVPPGCRFRVGNEVREWEEGKLLIFDDTIEHEAWNDSDQDRVVLIFDIWRPELTDQERKELTLLFSD